MEMDMIEKKLIKARNPEQVTEILKEEGLEIEPEQAEQIYQEAVHHQEGELSLEELEAVTGGSDRDWLRDGCAATVGVGSWCWSDDACYIWDVTYDHIPSAYCDCGGIMYSIGVEYCRCVVCGKEKRDDMDVIPCSPGPNGFGERWRRGKRS